MAPTIDLRTLGSLEFLYCWRWAVPPQKRHKSDSCLTNEDKPTVHCNLLVVISESRSKSRPSKPVKVRLDRIFRKMPVPPYMRIGIAEQKLKFDTLAQVERNHLVHGNTHPTTSEWATEAGRSQLASSRNRYTNVIAYDRTRVPLPVANTRSTCDYINASYIHLQLPQSEKIDTRYIAAQGPLASTSHHFWAMCFNESEKQGNDVIIIAMLTPTVESDMAKCSQYWPETEGFQVEFSDMLVKDGVNIQQLSLKNIASEYNEVGEFECTQLELRQGDKVKTVYHLYYQGWADTRVPTSLRPLLELSRVISQLQQTSTKGEIPVPIVHCSAGVGRTGTFMVLDTLLHMNDFHKIGFSEEEENKDYDPIFDLVDQLRNNRMMMVQTIHQYKFLYQAARDFYKATYYEETQQ